MNKTEIQIERRKHHRRKDDRTGLFIVIISIVLNFILGLIFGLGIIMK